jgi:hypothetical protein
MSMLGGDPPVVAGGNVFTALRARSMPKTSRKHAPYRACSSTREMIVTADARCEPAEPRSASWVAKRDLMA